MSPFLLYVTADSNPGGIGTLNDPYDSLAKALDSVRFNHTLIYLLQGVHRLTPTNTTAFLNLWNQDFSLKLTRTGFNITIEGYLCANNPLSESCSDTHPLLLLDNLNPVTFRVSGIVQLLHVHLSGNTTLVKGCELTTCKYCPKIQLDSSGNGIDDQGVFHPPGTFAPPSLCLPFLSQTLFLLTPCASLILTSHNIFNFKQGFSSLFSLSTGNLSFTQVVFLNVTIGCKSIPSPSSTTYIPIEAVISQAYSTSEQYLPGTISVSNCTIELLNNGYEFGNDLALGGFLNSKGIRSILIGNTTFVNSLSPSTMLINLGNVVVFSISSCVFDTVYAGQNMIRLSPTNTFATPSDSSLDHISIIGSQFTHCSVTLPGSTFGSLILIFFNTALLNIRLENTTISDSFFQASAIYIFNSGNQLAADKSGSTVVTRTATTRTVTFSRQKRCIVRNVTIESTIVCGTGVIGLVYFSGVVNFGAYYLKIAHSGDFFPDHSINSKTFQYLLGGEGTYMSRLPPQQSRTSCVKIFTYQRVYNSTVEDSEIVDTRCLDSTGSAGYHSGGGMGGDFVMNRVRLQGIFGVNPTTASCLHIVVPGNIYLTNLLVLNNQQTASGCVRIISSLSALNYVRNSTFLNNTGPGSVLQVIGSFGFELNNSVFDGNTAPTQAGLYIQSAPGLSPLRITITSSVFRRNIGTTGSAVYLANDLSNSSRVSFRAINCTFDSNQGNVLGSAIYIDSTNVLTSTSSVVQNCLFMNNTSVKGVVAVGFQSGNLTIDSCKFTNSFVFEPPVLTGKIGQYTGCIDASFLTKGSTPPSLKVYNTAFEGNEGTAIVRFSSLTENSTLFAENNTFVSNNGRPIAIERGKLIDSNSHYFHNSGDCFFITSEASASVSNATVLENIGYYAGAVYLGGASIGSFSNSVFETNTATASAGAIYVEQSSVLTVTQSIFRENSAVQGGAAVFIFGSLANNSISTSVFEDNHSLGAGTVGCLSSRLSLSKVTFRRNIASYAAGVLVYLSTVDISDSTFADQTAGYATFLHAAIHSSVSIARCHFEGAVSSGSGGVFSLLSAALTVSQSVFRNNTAKEGAVLLSESSSTFEVTDSVILESHSVNQAGGIVVMAEGTFLLQGTVIKGYVNGGMKLTETSDVKIEGTNFELGNSTSGAALSCTNCGQVRISHSSFVNLTAASASALSLSGHRDDSQSFSIVNSTFANLTGDTSGAIVINNADVTIQNSTFEESKATGLNAEGGAVLIQCPQMQCNVQIAHCNFSNNAATRKGGSISWNDYQPLLENNRYEGGQAEYGPDVASFPVSITIASIVGNGTVSTESTAHNHPPTQGVLFNVASGQITSHLISVNVQDHYHQNVLIENSLTASLAGVETDTSVVGNVTAQAVNGSITFQGFAVTAPPGRETMLHIVTNGLAAANDGQDFKSVLGLQVVMRQCVRGESQVGIQCVVCPEGKFSLDPDTPCQPCLIQAMCYGNFTMVPKAGYWRSSMYSEKFWECPNTNACVGSPAPPDPLSFTGDCADGYFGNLCNGCRNGYSRQSSSQCSPCPSLLLNTVKMTGIGVAVLVALVVIVKTSLSSALKPRSQYSIFIKILLNYLQLVMLTATFQLNWPYYMTEMFKIQQSAGNVTDEVFSIDCFLDTNKENSQENTVRMKLLGISFLPILLFGISLLFWLLIALFKHKISYLKNEMTATNVVFFFLVHPSIVKFMFSYFNCRELDPGQFWMDSYMNIRCWDFIHTRYAMIVALPSIIVWGVSIPMLCLVVIHQNRRMLLELRMKLRLGFVYNGYESSKYYWEFVILYRKIIIICISIFLRNISVSIQALTAMVVLLAAFGLQLKHKPYVVPTMNDLEVRAILVAAVTIYCGLYYMTSEMDPTSQMVLFVIVVTVNAYFMLTWAFRVLEAGCTALRLRFPCINRLFFGKYKLAWTHDLSNAGSGAGDKGIVVPERAIINRLSMSGVENESGVRRSPGQLGFSDSYVVPDNSKDASRDGGLP